MTNSNNKTREENSNGNNKKQKFREKLMDYNTFVNQQKTTKTS